MATECRTVRLFNVATGHRRGNCQISVADFCLSHKPNSTQSAYTRDFALSKRKDAMQKYNDWIEDAIGEYSVIKKCIQM